MINELAGYLLKVGWKPPLVRTFSSRTPVILLYHGVPVESYGSSINGKLFEEHIQFLKSHFKLVSPGDITHKRGATDKTHVLLTFDDGFRNNAEVVAPILRRHHVPAIFFVCSRHVSSGKYLWFSYLRALERHFPSDSLLFRGQVLDMSPAQRATTMQMLWQSLVNSTPHPAAMYQAIEQLPSLEDFIDSHEISRHYAGMTAEQVAGLAADPLFSIGAHTVDHPFLTKCDPREAVFQIAKNKKWIEQVTNQTCTAIAYPSGDYDERSLDQCRRVGFSYGYAVTPKLASNHNLELPRLGIYSTDTDILGFKVQWGNMMRRLRLPVG